MFQKSIENSLKELKYENTSLSFSNYLNDALSSAITTYTQCLLDARGTFDEESIHDLRVSIRRLSVALDVIITFTNSEYAKTAKLFVKAQFKSMSDLRDIQVMILRSKKLTKKFAQLFEFVNFLKRKEKQNIRIVKNILQSNSLIENDGPLSFLIFDVKEKLSIGYLDFNDLKNETDILYAKLEELADQIDPDEVETIHKTRITFKKFRYLYEFQIPAYTDSYFSGKELGEFQTKMGAIQDTEVIIKYLTTYIDTESSLTDLMPAMTFLIEERRRQIDEFVLAKDEFKKFWK